MTKLERRIHRLIEKAIVEHGYLVECASEAGTYFGYIDGEKRRCCAVGAIGVALGIEGGQVSGYQISQRSGIDFESLMEISGGFEYPVRPSETAPPLMHFGHELRQRYVVQQ